MNFVIDHFGEVLTAICFLLAAIAAGVGTYIAVRVDLAIMHERQNNFGTKLDDHVKDRDIHNYGRRETDGTGHYPQYRGN